MSEQVHMVAAPVPLQSAIAALGRLLAACRETRIPCASEWRLGNREEELRRAEMEAERALQELDQPVETPKEVADVPESEWAGLTYPFGTTEAEQMSKSDLCRRANQRGIKIEQLRAERENLAAMAQKRLLALEALGAQLAGARVNGLPTEEKLKQWLEIVDEQIRQAEGRKRAGEEDEVDYTDPQVVFELATRITIAKKGDEEAMHGDLDKLLLDVVRAHGHGRLADLFDNQTLWYA